MPSSATLSASSPKPKPKPKPDSNLADATDSLQEQDLVAFSNPAPSTSHLPQTWAPLCEYGGIEPHLHQATMNGAGSGDPTTTPTTGTGTGTGPGQRRGGRLRNHVQVAKSYVFEQEIQNCLRETGVSQAREDSIRLAGVQWIDNVRRALKL